MSFGQLIQLFFTRFDNSKTNTVYPKENTTDVNARSIASSEMHCEICDTCWRHHTRTYTTYFSTNDDGHDFTVNGARYR